MKDNENKTISYEELSLSNMWQLEALYRLMINKGLITKDEYENELKDLKVEYDKENHR